MLGRVDRQRRPVAHAQLLEALEQPAVDQDAAAIEIEQVLRAGDRARGTEERQRRHRLTILDRMVRPDYYGGGLLAALTIVLCRAAAPASAQQKLLTLDDIYGPDSRVQLQRQAGAGDHLDRRRSLRVAASAGRDAASIDWMTVDAATGVAAPLFDAPSRSGARRASRRCRRRGATAGSLARSVLQPAYSAAILHDRRRPLRRWT